jgi:ferric-dicitrate binding protein FerR (iron transport regulator)
MKIEADLTNENRTSVHESKMTRRRAIGFLAGGALCAVAMLYFGFLSSPGVSADSTGDNSTSTSQSSTTTEESSTTSTGRPGSGGW